jgi:hypothetical protein
MILTNIQLACILRHSKKACIQLQKLSVSLSGIEELHDHIPWGSVFEGWELQDELVFGPVYIAPNQELCLYRKS